MPQKNFFLVESFGIDGFKLFIVNNDEKIFNKLLDDFKKCEPKSNQKLKLCVVTICVETWQKTTHKVKEQSTHTAQVFFHILEQFAKLKKTDCMNILILKNDVQNLFSSTCGEFQLYFL